MQRVLGGVMLILIYNSFKILNVNLLNNRTHPIATGAWLTPQRALGKVTPCLVRPKTNSPSPAQHLGKDCA
jgi:hypothetical protein